MVAGADREGPPLRHDHHPHQVGLRDRRDRGRRPGGLRPRPHRDVQRPHRPLPVPGHLRGPLAPGLDARHPPGRRPRPLAGGPLPGPRGRGQRPALRGRRHRGGDRGRRRHRSGRLGAGDTRGEHLGAGGPRRSLHPVLGLSGPGAGGVHLREPDGDAQRLLRTEHRHRHRHGLLQRWRHPGPGHDHPGGGLRGGPGLRCVPEARRRRLGLVDQAQRFHHRLVAGRGRRGHQPGAARTARSTWPTTPARCTSSTPRAAGP